MKIKMLDGDVVNTMAYWRVSAELQEMVDGFQEGQWIDAIAVGEFRPMNSISTVVFTEAELEIYLENTLQVIKSAVDADDAVLGLPIDAEGHKHGSGAAGFIADARLGENKQGPVVQLLPKWTELGVRLIKENLFRRFSGNINMMEKVLEGGSLTNWPAMIKENGEHMLRAVTLAAGDDQSLNDQIRSITDMFFNLTGEWVEDVFDTDLVASIDGKLMRIGYTVNDDGVPIFDPAEKWEQVKQVYVKAEGGADKTMQTSAPKPKSENGYLKILAKNIVAKFTKGEPTMELKLKNLLGANVPDTSLTVEFDSLEADSQLALQLEATKSLIPSIDGENDVDYTKRLVEFSELLKAQTPDKLTGSVGQMDVANQAKVEAEMARLAAENDRNYKMAVARLQEDRVIVEFTTKAVHGDKEFAHVIPMKIDELEKFTRSLHAGKQRETFIELIQQIQRTGLVEFKEVGSAGKNEGTAKLPDQVAVQLTAWIEVEGNTIDEFFDINQVELGSKDDYVLTDFVKKE